MRGCILAVVCSILLCGAGIAQTPISPDTASKEDIVRFLDLAQIRPRMVQLMDGMKNGMKTGAEAGLRQQLPGATSEQLAKADAMADAIFKDFPIDEMIDAMIPIYQRHLTKTDLESVIAFYSSPAGQKLLKEQPAMMAEGMKAGQDIMLKKLPALTQRLNAEVAQLAKEEAEKKSPSPAR